MNKIIIIDSSEIYSKNVLTYFKHNYIVKTYTNINQFGRFKIKPSDLLIFILINEKDIIDMHVFMEKYTPNCHLLATTCMLTIEKKLYKEGVFLVLPFFYSQLKWLELVENYLNNNV